MNETAAPADIDLTVHIPGIVTSANVDKHLAEHPGWSRAEAWQHELRCLLGGWVDVDTTGEAT